MPISQFYILHVPKKNTELNKDLESKREEIPIVEMEEPNILPANNEDTYPNKTYLIITTNAIKANSGMLDDFVRYKQASGFRVQVITEDDYGPQVGKLRAINIRNYLRYHYEEDNIQFALLIGDPDPDIEGEIDSVGDIPMMYCYPRSGMKNANATATDYFYADLTNDWDIDGDGLFGESDDDYSGPDFHAEVLVGRIPVYGNNYGDLDDILFNIIHHHSTNNDPGEWKKNFLLAMAMLNYDNENNNGDSRTDGLNFPERVCDDIIYPINEANEVHVQHEREGENPVPTNVYEYDEPINMNNFINAFNDGFIANDGAGFVFWYAHGSSTSAQRKIWDDDANFNGIPEGDEIEWVNFIDSNHVNQLDTNHPSFFYLASCLCGRPEIPNNLGYELLKSGAAVSTISSSRVSWYCTGVWDPQIFWQVETDNVGIGYQYMHYLIELGLCAGKALYLATYDGSDDENYRGNSWMNKMNFNLYGDPQMRYWWSVPPNPPTNPMPSESANNVDLNPTLSIDVSDNTDFDVNVVFYDASDDSLIGYDTDVQSGDTANVTWYNLNGSTTYQWYAIVGDGQAVIKSSEYSFTTKNQAPLAPVNPSPANGAEIYTCDPTLSVDVFDDANEITVLFYDATYGNFLGGEFFVENGGTGSTTWEGREEGETYCWYALAFDGVNTTRSENFTFKIKYITPYMPYNPSPAHGATNVAIDPTLSVEVSDPNSDNLTVCFFNNDTVSMIGCASQVEDGTIASLKWLGRLENSTYSWFVIANDGENSIQSETWSFTTGFKRKPLIRGELIFGIGAPVLGALALAGIVIFLSKRRS